MFTAFVSDSFDMIQLGLMHFANGFVWEGGRQGGGVRGC